MTMFIIENKSTHTVNSPKQQQIIKVHDVSTKRYTFYVMLLIKGGHNNIVNLAVYLRIGGTWL